VIQCLSKVELWNSMEDFENRLRYTTQTLYAYGLLVPVLVTVYQH
jgi:hypothetical protein